MSDGLTPSEQFVNKLCNNTFFALWTFPNPYGKKDKELCDCLVVCDNKIIIISVKEIKYKSTEDITTGWERWTKAAINKSISQLNGAERWLTSQSSFKDKDGIERPLPPKSEREYYKLSVSIGSNRKVPISWGDDGNGLIYVCDESSFEKLTFTLDTISDLISFFKAMDVLSKNQVKIILNEGGLEDLIASYIMNGYSFENYFKNNSMLILENDIWDGFTSSEAFKQLEEDKKASLLWDNLVSYFTETILAGQMINTITKEISNDQHAVLEMIKQPRQYRAIIANALNEFIEKQIPARAVMGTNNTCFVFMSGVLNSREERESRYKILLGRCLLIKKRQNDIAKIVGITADFSKQSPEDAFDIIYQEGNLTTEQEAIAIEFEKQGYFKDAQFTNHNKE